jgi:Ca2+/Na+ antiporter
MFPLEKAADYEFTLHHRPRFNTLMKLIVVAALSLQVKNKNKKRKKKRGSVFLVLYFLFTVVAVPSLRSNVVR